MKELKFRAWDKIENEMILYSESDCISFDLMYIQGLIPMQYIGIKDKCGIDIYEGDVVKCDMSFNGGTLPHAGEIVYLDGFSSFATKNDGGVTLLHNHISSSFKVIGNIHENPELL